MYPEYVCILCFVVILACEPVEREQSDRLCFVVILACVPNEYISHLDHPLQVESMLCLAWACFTWCGIRSIHLDTFSVNESLCSLALAQQVGRGGAIMMGGLGRTTYFGMQDEEEAKFAACRWGFGQSHPEHNSHNPAPCVSAAREEAVEMEREQGEQREDEGGGAGAMGSTGEQTVRTMGGECAPGMCVTAEASPGCRGDACFRGCGGEAAPRCRGGSGGGVDGGGMDSEEQNTLRHGTEEKFENDEEGEVDERQKEDEGTEVAPRQDGKVLKVHRPRFPRAIRHIPAAAKRSGNRTPMTPAKKSQSNGFQKYILNEYYMSNDTRSYEEHALIARHVSGLHGGKKFDAVKVKQWFMDRRRSGPPKQMQPVASLRLLTLGSERSGIDGMGGGSSRGSITSGVGRFKVGERVLALYSNDRRWYQAVLHSYLGSGKWKIKWNDRDPRDTVKSYSQLRLRVAVNDGEGQGQGMEEEQKEEGKEEEDEEKEDDVEEVEGKDGTGKEEEERAAGKSQKGRKSQSNGFQKYILNEYYMSNDTRSYEEHALIARHVSGLHGGKKFDAVKVKQWFMDRRSGPPKQMQPVASLRLLTLGSESSGIDGMGGSSRGSITSGDRRCKGFPPSPSVDQPPCEPFTPDMRKQRELVLQRARVERLSANLKKTACPNCRKVIPQVVIFFEG
jgi:hypothetical protein